VCNLLSLIMYPKRVYFASLMPTAEYWGSGPHAPKQGHNHNLDIIALNYPCPVSWLRVVSHNRTKCRENGTEEQNYFLSIMSMQLTTHLSDPGGRPDPPPPPPQGSGARCRCFLALIVGAPGSLATPPAGACHHCFLC
jgi:hypothetical protein